MATIWVQVLILLLTGAAWAADPLLVVPKASKEEPPAEEAAPADLPGPPPPPGAKQQLREIDRRIGVLESLMVGRGHGRGLMERGLGWSPELRERGFFLFSKDGKFRLHLNGGIQVDYRAFPKGQTGRDPGTEPDSFEVRRLRPIVDFRIARYFRGQIMPDLASSSPLFNAFLEWDRYEWARVRVGQFKSNFNIENQQGEFDLVFAERSLVQNFALRRSFGVQVTGRVVQRQLRYDTGVFNSNNGLIGNRSRPEPSAEEDKIGYLRLMATPFLLQGPRALRKLDVGVGVAFGSCEATACQQPMVTMGQDRVIFQYRDSVTGNGFHTRVLPQMSWFWGRVGMMATFIHTWEPKRDRVTGQTATLQHEAWMVQGELALTDDEPAFNRITPKNPFDPSKRGHWGAWALAARYSEQRIDPDAFGLNFADATRFVRTTKAFTLDLTWYATREFRTQWIWDHSDFQGADASYAASGTSDLFITRFTLIY